MNFLDHGLYILVLEHAMKLILLAIRPGTNS